MPVSASIERTSRDTSASVIDFAIVTGFRSTGCVSLGTTSGHALSKAVRRSNNYADGNKNSSGESTMIFRLIILAALLFPIIGSLLLELGMWGQGINQYGSPNGATLAMLAFATVFLTTVLAIKITGVLDDFGAGRSVIMVAPSTICFRCSMLLVPMAAICLLWMVGELAASNAVTQFALVALIVLYMKAGGSFALTDWYKLPLDANATPALVGFFAKANALGETTSGPTTPPVT